MEIVLGVVLGIVLGIGRVLGIVLGVLTVWKSGTGFDWCEMAKTGRIWGKIGTVQYCKNAEEIQKNRVKRSEPDGSSN